MSNVIYRVGKKDTPQGSFYATSGQFDGKPYYEVYFKRTVEPRDHYLYDGFNCPKEACKAVDALVKKWLSDEDKIITTV